MGGCDTRSAYFVFSILLSTNMIGLSLANAQNAPNFDDLIEILESDPPLFYCSETLSARRVSRASARHNETDHYIDYTLHFHNPEVHIDGALITFFSTNPLNIESATRISMIDCNGFGAYVVEFLCDAGVRCAFHDEAHDSDAQLAARVTGRLSAQYFGSSTQSDVDDVDGRFVFGNRATAERFQDIFRQLY